MKYHHVVEDIKKLLEKGNCWYEAFEHRPVRTSEEAAKIRLGYTLKQGAKAIIVRVKKSGGVKYFAMVVIPGDQRFDTNKVKSLLNAKDIRFATEAEIKQLTDGIELGGVPPFGNLFDLEVIADLGLLSNEKIIFNAGDRRLSIAVKSMDYRNLVNPKVASIT